VSPGGPADDHPDQHQLVRGGHRVRKANRVADSSADPDLNPFTFTEAGLREFDAVWLIGWTIGELGSDYWSQRLTANADAKYLFSRLLILI